MMLSADLHTHTWLSDGALSPSALVQRAHERGITHLAITDHDSTAAIDSLDRLAVPDGITLIPGVEISCSWPADEPLREIHIVGLFMNTTDPDLQDLLGKQQTRRRERAMAINSKLEKNGITGLPAYLDSLPCEAISRNHIADYLIQLGVARNKQQAFKRLLGQQGRYSIAANWCDITTAVKTIQAAGGIPVLAHPDRYRLGKNQFRHLLEDFSEAGGEGLEVSYSNLNPDTLKDLAKRAAELQLWASVGSDFHSPEQHWMDIGRVRQLPASIAGQAIWHHPVWLRTLPRQ